MNQFFNGKSIFRLGLLCVVSSILISCTETETIEPPALRANRLLEFEVTNVAEPIFGAINDIDSTITVYLPYYYYLSIMQARVEVSEGATVAPASGAYITDLEKVINGDSVITYTVKDAEGAAASYQLFIETQQPSLVIDELSTAEDTLQVQTSVLYDIGGTIYEIPNYLQITGNNFLMSASGESILEVNFEAEDGTLYPAGEVSVTGLTSASLTVPFNDEIPNGIYKLKASLYTQSAVLEYPIKIQSPF